jgi:hypothetical protein
MWDRLAASLPGLAATIPANRAARLARHGWEPLLWMVSGGGPS